MDKIFFEFPLCVLSFIGNDKNKLDNIISWCIVNHANNLTEGPHKERVSDSASFFELTGSSYSARVMRFNTLETHIKNFETVNGKDAFCRIGKTLTFEARDGSFDLNQFKILCAIQSIIGKKKAFVRITYERIAYRMLGFKSKEIFEAKKGTVEPLSYKQLRRIVELLHAKKFYSKFTYSNRQMFFSTRLDDEALKEKIKESKIYWAKKNKSIEDRKFSANIKSELEKINLENRTQREAEKLQSQRLMKTKIYRLAKVN